MAHFNQILNDELASKFSDKVIIITGASEGIGRALAIALASFDCQLVITARNLERLNSLAAELTLLGQSPLVHVADVTQQEQCSGLIQACMSHFGRLDILINNAGMTMWSRFDELEDLSVLSQIMQVNYLASAYLTHAAIPHLKLSQGQIVAVASLAGMTGVPTRSGYAASKHAMIGFFDSLRIELTDDKVAVTLICPDFVVSQIHKRALDEHGKPLGDTPMQESKIMTAEECAQMMLPAIAKRQRMLITSFRGRIGRWFKVIAPSLIDKIARRAIASGR
ncbi:SDR family oxidoreductase [Shewanella fidelis]|uniref:SDR family oxidoreductase n=1 Tax=Shewanella fidelis TaxID=173509 RepID=A0AAW8NRG2_9GAMM|nr:SDR family oxidoreductase [Shewanella fidelis]MDR8525376.1 SDR family oxidoreductase [Shewanella fidelis]MDW4813588.1 SDR family oxidoreductase [Shewanella fidelis]MDW4817754.1 SDR family oxidoreductase [Shewanella fidelis]MDW4821821.1 SDR family oxidoreductase [Shewanella fidelis]MDW4825916.1 SDR family oxidoreductase [Shewanella fidelis]